MPPRNSRCRRLLRNHPGLVLVPILVVTEVAYLLETRVGVETEVRFLSGRASGAAALGCSA
ncbi:MAG: hypothetical protein M3072_02855 [Candidatus Dormibacteraeota bacterium]|nr:hypothetical protein [Candidatus Dormibacteraeota bacterium]